MREITPPPGDRRFTVSARRDGNAWRVTADGVDEGKFMDHQSLSLRVISDRAHILEMPQAAPGRYEVVVPGVESFIGVAVRQGEDGERLVGRIQPARVALGEWPASYRGPAFTAPAGAFELSADVGIRQRWAPRIERARVPLGMYLWVGSIAAALGALWLRRGHMRLPGVLGAWTADSRMASSRKS
jgi:hypothetical protein